MESLYLQISVDKETSYKITKGHQVIEENKQLDLSTLQSAAQLYYGTINSEKTQKLADEIETKYIAKSGIHHTQIAAHLFKGLGHYVFEQFLPPKIKREIEKTPRDTTICLDLDDASSIVPWELMYNGRNFLCIEYEFGRILSPFKTLPGKHAPSASLLMISDPTGDLPGAQIEANYIMSQLRGSKIRVQRYGSELRKRQYLELLKSGKFDFIHYTGHSSVSTDQSQAFHIFKDENLTGKEIEALKGNNLPRLVFTNSCQSAQNYDFSGNTSLAGSYIKAGVLSCIAALWPVSDQGSAEFASSFYRYILFGSTVGRAILQARRESYRKWGYQDFIWGSYIFYGNPLYKLL
jgi:CHAT domain-containing protein